LSLLLILAADADNAISTDDAAFLKAVGTILRQRTVERDSGGREAGTFNNLTRPLGTQVRELRDDQAREDLEGEVGDLDKLKLELPSLANDIDSLLALGTALVVELTYFAGDISVNRSPYPQLDARYTRRVAALKRNVAQLRDGQPEGVADPTPAPVYSFPPAPRYDDDCSPWARDPRRW
jgi:hypothetical protein